jgi:ABC-type phosphate/phosphonate transport system permease subunit
MEVEVTWSRAAMVWWAYIWRLAVATIASALAGAVVGGIMGVFLAILKAPQEAILVVTLPVGLLIGVAASIVPMKMILGKDFGDFRLVLVSKQPAQTPG